MKPFSALALAPIAAIIAATGAAAQTTDGPAVTDWRTRPALLDGPDGPKEALRARGIIVDVSHSQFYQGMVSGTEPNDWEYGGKVDAIATLDGGKIGLWEGLYVNIHQEWVYGEDLNNRGGTAFPANTALGFPRFGGLEHDTSIIVTQVFSPQVSLTAGKFNMLDVLTKTPLLGGGGIDTFMNVALAAPVTGITPPYLLGANLTVKTEPAIFSFMVYDPRNAQDWDVIEHPFADGTTILGSITVPVKIGGLTGFQGLKAIWSSQDGLDLADIPQLFLPPESATVLGDKGSRWFLSYSFQQYLYQNSSNPQQGWGLFGQVSVSDGNPNPIEASFLAGLAGSSFLPGREDDRWGVGYFRYNISDDLIGGLDKIGVHLSDERGIEAFYNFAVTPWFRISADIQYVEPIRKDRDDATFIGLRSQMKL